MAGEDYATNEGKVRKALEQMEADGPPASPSSLLGPVIIALVLIALIVAIILFVTMFSGPAGERSAGFL